MRNRLGLGNGPTVLGPRAMRSMYRYDVTLEAIARMRQAIPDVTFIFRDYNAHPLDYAAQLSKRAQSLGVSEAVRFIDPVARHKDMSICIAPLAWLSRCPFLTAPQFQYLKRLPVACRSSPVTYPRCVSGSFMRRMACLCHWITKY